MSEERVDAVVIGANIRGLVASHVLAQLGYKTVVLERGKEIGGVDGSFVTEQGTRFDHGLHVLDENRSEVATKLFTSIVDGAVNRVKLERGLVLRNHIVPYAPRPSDLPAELRELLHTDDIRDDIGNELPTRTRISAVYGPRFADLIFDEVLPSYPTENRHRAFGIDESRLMANIYPWFFPRAERRQKEGDESRAFHDRLRSGIDQYILYPKTGGFSGFAMGFANKLRAAGVTILTGATDSEVIVQPGTHRITAAVGGGRRFVADRYFWASAWPGLAKTLSLRCQDVATDLVLLGSFRLSRAPKTRFHELLVGDPAHRINRLYFPDSFAGSQDHRLQIEFSIPKAEDWPKDKEHWRQSWLASLLKLGIIDEGHTVAEFDFRAFPLHFNSFGMEGVPLVDADPTLLAKDTNVHPIVPSMANLNLNTYIPRTIRQVTELLTP